MKISKVPGSDGYSLFLAHPDAVVLLDGERLDDWRTADDNSGLVDRAVNESGKDVAVGAYGAVSIELTPNGTADGINEHIADVQNFLGIVVDDIYRRGHVHDASKFDPIEFGPLQEMANLVAKDGQATFGSDEYERRKALLGPMLTHHYAKNDHHPEHHDSGIAGMTLASLVEMFCDWAAAAKRRDPDGTMNLTFSVKKYDIPPMLERIFRNTADVIGIRHK